MNRCHVHNLLMELRQGPYGSFLTCARIGCDVRQNCNRGGVPVGEQTRQPTRDARKRAHAAFDGLWKGGLTTRTGAYDWLARELGLPADAAHIAKFDVATCDRVVELVKDFVPRIGTTLAGDVDG